MGIARLAYRDAPALTAAAIHGNVVITAAGPDIAVHQPALPRSAC